MLTWGIDMNRFHKLEDAAAILRIKGLYKQVPVYSRGNELYAGHGGGFIRLYEKGTSIPTVSLEELDVGEPGYVVGDHGRLFLP